MHVAFNDWFKGQMQHFQTATSRGGSPSPILSDSTNNSSNNTKHSVFNKFPSVLSPSSGRNNQTVDLEANLTGTRTHVRTWFDPENEIPLLQAWLAENRHPTRAELGEYLMRLNSSEYRQIHRLLDLSNIAYWFKNARSRLLTRKLNDSNSSEGCPLGGSDKQLDGQQPPMSQIIPDRNRQHVDDLEGEKNLSNNLRDENSVPVLPNKNAVYVVSPLYHTPTALNGDAVEKSNRSRDTIKKGNFYCSSPVSNSDCPAPKSDRSSLKSDRIESVASDENHNVHHHGIVQNEATDLSVCCGSRGFRSAESLERDRTSSLECHSRDEARSLSRGSATSDVCSPRRGEKRTRKDSEEFSGSDSSSPRLQMDIRSAQLPAPQFSLPSHGNVHALHQHQAFHQQHVLQMSAMSHAMRFLLPSSAPLSLYNFSRGVGGPMFLPPMSSSSPSYEEDNNHDSSSGSFNGDGGDRKKRSRVFIDPLSEIPKLEQWFLSDSHPSSFVIEQFTEELNRSTYRQRFPRLEPKNIQLWFKNHRAKVKRQHVVCSSSSADSGVAGSKYAESRTLYNGKLCSVWDSTESRSTQS